MESSAQNVNGHLAKQGVAVCCSVWHSRRYNIYAVTEIFAYILFLQKKYWHAQLCIVYLPRPIQ